MSLKTCTVDHASSANHLFLMHTGLRNGIDAFVIALDVTDFRLTQSKGDAFFEYKVEIQLSSFNEATEARKSYVWKRYSAFRYVWRSIEI